MALLKRKRIYCSECNQEIEFGTDAFDWHQSIYCEACFDKELEELKEDSRVEVNYDNFDLEIEE